MPPAVLERERIRQPVTSRWGAGYDLRGSLLVPTRNGPRELKGTDHSDVLVTRRLQKLNTRIPTSPIPGLHFRNATIAELVEPGPTQRSINAISEVLIDSGAFKINVRNGVKVPVDGIMRPVSVVKATEVSGSKGDMVEKVWVRDQTQAAGALFEMWKIDPQRYKQEGEMAKDLLMSTLHLMSTDAQLDRFSTIIADDNKEDPDKAEARDHMKHPQIAMLLTPDHLSSTTPTSWRHVQEAWQMLGVTALDAIKTGLIPAEELLEGNKQFFASMMPFLAAVNFPNNESSGSWEENMSMKTSVTAVETALLHRVQNYANEAGFEFLKRGYQDAQEGGHLPDRLKGVSFETAIDTMVDDGLERIAQSFPFESPMYSNRPGDKNYDKDYDVKNRGIDISLLYLLDYDIPKLLVEHQKPIGGEMLTVKEIEKKILDAVELLYDPQTHGYKRYIGDSYQGLDFHSDEKQKEVNGLKADIDREAKAENRPIDLHEKQRRRYGLIKPGHEATWAHPNAQVAIWAGRRFSETGDPWYKQQEIKYYYRSLATITGDEYHAVVNGNDRHEIRKVPELRFVESFSKRSTPDGNVITTVGPFVPFNWGTSLGRLATVRMQETMAQEEALAGSQEHVLVRFSAN